MVLRICSDLTEARRTVLQRCTLEGLGEPEAAATVAAILRDVRERGDDALLDYTERFDGVRPMPLMVGREAVEDAYAAVDGTLVDDLRLAASRIELFHAKQRRYSYLDLDGNSLLAQLVRPMERVGIYVPGGRAVYPSSVLMTAIPARVAGVGEVVMVTPPNRDGRIAPSVLVAADIAGVDRIFRVGGAQAIAALAYGTESVSRVDKIVGPGNLYVVLAQKMVLGQVGIGALPGPSEVLILADEMANPAYVAADLLSQAEHDPLAICLLVTPSLALAHGVEAELGKQLESLQTAPVAREALARNGGIVIVGSLAEGLAIANEFAPEHLELLVQDPMSLLPKVRHAGAVFLGPYSPEPLGDYAAGTNHVLPTAGTARFSSALGVDDFLKKTSVVSFSREQMLALGGAVVRLAESEGLSAHAAAVRKRMGVD